MDHPCGNADDIIKSSAKDATTHKDKATDFVENENQPKECAPGVNPEDTYESALQDSSKPDDLKLNEKPIEVEQDKEQTDGDTENEQIQVEKLEGDSKKLDHKEESEEEELHKGFMDLPQPTIHLPGEKEACVGASAYNLDNLEELEGAVPDNLEQPSVEKKKSFMKKPTFKPKKVIVSPDKLDEDLGVIKLTKDESEKRLGEYVSTIIMNKLKSPKWESKVIGIQWLQEWLITNKVPVELTEYAFRLLKGVMKDWKEINSNLTKASVEFINGVLQDCQKLGRRAIGIIIPYL